MLTPPDPEGLIMTRTRFNGKRPHGATRIEALNYRCLRYVRRDLRPFHLLVGPNASGKSTLLDVLNFLGDLVRSDLDTAVRGDPRLDIIFRAPDPQHLTWMRRGQSFELAIEMAIPEAVRKAKETPQEVVRYEVCIEVENQARIAVENVWLKPADADDPVASPRQALLFPVQEQPPEHIVRLPNKKSPRGWKKVVSRSESGQTYFIAETTGWNAPFALSPHKTSLASLPEDRNRFPCALWLRDVFSSGVRRLALSAEAMRLPSAPTLQAGYLPDGSNLSYVVARLEEKEDLYKRWIAHVQEALPDIETVTTAERPEDRHRYLIVRYRNGLEAPSWLISDGTLRTLALTLLAYATDTKGGLLLIEEPENGIHPRAAQTVFQALSSVYDTQILIATHLPLILGLASLDDLLCFGRTEEGATDIVAGREHPRLRDWQGTLDLSTLFAAGVLG